MELPKDRGKYNYRWPLRAPPYPTSAMEARLPSKEKAVGSSPTWGVHQKYN